jgi:hypothetical protein
MMKLNSLARAQVIDPEGGAEDGAAGAGVGEGAASVDVLVVSSSFRIFPLLAQILAGRFVITSSL